MRYFRELFSDAHIRQFLVDFGFGGFIESYEKHFGEKKTKRLLQWIASIPKLIVICLSAAAIGAVIWIIQLLARPDTLPVPMERLGIACLRRVQGRLCG